MADQGRAASGSETGHLDATGSREVVYCHQCDNEWHRDEHGLVCPRCTGEITEIVSADSDPRPYHEPPPRRPSDLRTLEGHNPWADGDISDPEEADIEEHINHGANGSVTFTRTIRSGHRPQNPNDPAYFMRDIQNVVGNLIGPGFRAGQAGRSGPDDLFPPGPFGGNGFVFGNNGGNVRGHMTFTTGNLRPRDPNGPQPAGPQIDDLATYAPLLRTFPNGRSLYIIRIRARPDQVTRILGNLLGATPGAGPNDRGFAGGLPPGLAGLFQSMLNPANARSGDAVYTQEALDQIISQLMEQHPTSNAPGPASPDAIASLPKKKIDEKMLGPEGKAECSVCMDDVQMGDEVVALPCSHWFHETCASAWLSEHNTCPICRKGIDAQPTPATPNNQPPHSQQSTPPESSSTTRATRPSRFSRGSGNSWNNSARLESIRNTAGLGTPNESSSQRRWQVVGDGTRRLSRSSPTSPDIDDYSTLMPGSFNRRASDMSENQRDSRRGHTSGSDRSSRDSRRSSRSDNSGGSGPVSWLRDRFGGNRRTE